MKKELDIHSLNYVIYCRRSSEDASDKQVQSIETQMRELEELKNSLSLNVVAVFTESQSAHTPGRPKFEEMMNIFRNGKANALLVVRANRIARNPVDSGQIIYLMDLKKLLYIRTSSGTSYKNTPSDKTMLQVEFAFSKKDSDDKSEMVKEGFRTKYLKGTPGGVAPIGFKNTPYLDRGQRHWLVDEEKFLEVKHLFKEFLTGKYSGNKLAEYARDVRKLTTPIHKKSGGKLVEKSYINHLLKNPIYAGFFFSEGIRYELDRKLPRVISEAEHYLILTMLGTKHKTRFQKHENLYSDFLKGENNKSMIMDNKFQLICDCRNKFAYRKVDKCPKCGLLIEKMINPRYYHRTYYFNGEKRHKKQIFKSIEETEIKKKTHEEIIAPLSLLPELATWVKKYLHEIQDEEIQEALSLEQNTNNVAEIIEKEKTDLRALLRRGVITEDEYRKDLVTIENKLPKQHEVVVDWKEKIVNIVDMGLECAKVFENGTLGAKKEILFKSQSNLIWDEKNLYVTKPKWLETYIIGVNLIKSKIGTVEPKIVSEFPIQNSHFLETGVVKYEECKGLLRGLESN